MLVFTTSTTNINHATDSTALPSSPLQQLTIAPPAFPPLAPLHKPPLQYLRPLPRRPPLSGAHRRHTTPSRPTLRRAGHCMQPTYANSVVACVSSPDPVASSSGLALLSSMQRSHDELQIESIVGFTNLFHAHPDSSSTGNNDNKSFASFYAFSASANHHPIQLHHPRRTRNHPPLPLLHATSTDIAVRDTSVAPTTSPHIAEITTPPCRDATASPPAAYTETTIVRHPSVLTSSTNSGRLHRRPPCLPSDWFRAAPSCSSRSSCNHSFQHLHGRMQRPPSPSTPPSPSPSPAPSLRHASRPHPPRLSDHDATSDNFFFVSVFPDDDRALILHPFTRTSTALHTAAPMLISSQLTDLRPSA